MSFWSRKTFCVVSGASKGFGASLAITFAHHLAPGSVLVLLARNAEGLNATKVDILSKRTDLKVFVWVIDLKNLDVEDLKNRFAELLAQDEECQPLRFYQCLIIHNAASLGNVAVPFTRLMDKNEINEYLNLNITSVILLNSVFFNIFTKSVTSKRYVVQISSKGAKEPFKHWGLYCGAKAARGMLFKVMSAEEEDVRVLSYAPGPLQTDMFLEALNNSGHPETKKLFQEMQQQGILRCEQSAERLVNILEDDKFESGCHLDYYDCDN